MIADLVVLFPAPCSLLLILYSIRFTVARSEAEAVSGVTNGASCINSELETKSSKSTGCFLTRLFAVAFIISNWLQSTMLSSLYPALSTCCFGTKHNIFIINIVSVLLVAWSTQIPSQMPRSIYLCISKPVECSFCKGFFCFWLFK